jgi:hypothetical protein
MYVCGVNLDKYDPALEENKAVRPSAFCPSLLEMTDPGK